MNPGKQKALQNFKRIEQHRRKLMIDLAARAYELETGHPPKSIAELVPGYLKAMPLDPVTGTSMVYQP